MGSVTILRVASTGIAIALLSCAQLMAHAQAARATAGGQAEAEQVLNRVIDQVWELGDLHWHKGEYNHIVNICKICAAADPTNLDAFANGAWLLWSMDRDSEAIAMYQEALKTNPNSYYMYDEVGLYYFNRKKDYPLAIKYLEKASSMPDSRFSTLHTLAHAYEKSGNLAMSEKTWERAAKDPKDTAAKLNLDRVRRKMKSR